MKYIINIDLDHPIAGNINRFVDIDTGIMWELSERTKQKLIPVRSEDDCVSRQTAIDALYHVDEYNGRSVEAIRNLPPAEPEWNNHTVACLLAELFDDTCACNYNDIDEWLPKKCELLDSCPNPDGVACWEQFLKHKAERRTDDKADKGASR